MELSYGNPSTCARAEHQRGYLYNFRKEEETRDGKAFLPKCDMPTNVLSFNER